MIMLIIKVIYNDSFIYLLNVGSEATRFYLDLMTKITSCFLDKSLTPIERLYRVWFVVFAFRGWKYWLRANEYSLELNFISLNAYLCAEINAHGLISTIIQLEHENRPSHFLPWLWSSQPCESIFRAARSLNPTGSTQVNFTLKDLLINRSTKIDASIHLTSSGKDDGISYPRIEKKLKLGNVHIPTSLPNRAEIEQVVLRAREDAENMLASLGN